MFDAGKFRKLLIKYPKLAIVLLSGVVSKKLTRTMLDIDKWLVEDLYAALITCGAVRGLTNATFRATKEAENYIKEEWINEHQNIQ